MDFRYSEAGARLAADLINTYAWHRDREGLNATADVRRFMTEHGQDRPIADADLARLIELRTALRGVFAAGGESDAEQRINALLAAYPVHVVLRPGPDAAGVAFEPAAPGFVDWAGATAAVGLAFFVAERGWSRLGTCAASDCDDAYVDASKNSHKRYCSNGCARNESVRAFRRRKRNRNDAA